MAVIPDYIGLNPPKDVNNNPLTSAGQPSRTPTTISLPANSAPSGIAVDSVSVRARHARWSEYFGQQYQYAEQCAVHQFAGGTPTLERWPRQGECCDDRRVDDNLHVAAV